MLDDDNDYSYSSSSSSSNRDDDREYYSGRFYDPIGFRDALDPLSANNPLSNYHDEDSIPRNNTNPNRSRHSKNNNHRSYTNQEISEESLKHFEFMISVHKKNKAIKERNWVDNYLDFIHKISKYIGRLFGIK